MQTMTGQSKKTMKLVLPTEDQEQAKLVAWLRKFDILFFAVPNGGYRNTLEAFKLKRTGVQSGVPDIMIPVARKGFHGLFIEMKRQKGGVLSQHQKHWLSNLIFQKYCAKVANGADVAIALVTEYLEMGTDKIVENNGDQAA